MNCKKCGAPLSNEDVFCKNCGTPVNDNSAVQNQNMMNNGKMYSNVTSNPVNVDMTNNMGANNVNSVSNSQGVANNSLNGNISNQQMNYGNYMNTAMPNNMPNQNPVSTNGVVNDADKKKKTILIAGIAGAIVVVVLAVILTTNNIKNSDKNNNAGNNSGNNNGSEVNNGSGTNNGGSNTVVPTPSSTSTYKVKYANFTFNIPDNMVYQVTDSELMLGDEDETWVAELVISDGSFNKLKSNMGQLQGLFNQNGFDAKPAELKNIGTSEFITLEMLNGGINYLSAYTKINSMKLAWIVYHNAENTVDYDALTKINDIITTATYSEQSTNITGSSKINLDNGTIFNLAQ